MFKTYGLSTIVLIFTLAFGSTARAEPALNADTPSVPWEGSATLRVSGLAEGMECEVYDEEGYHWHSLSAPSEGGSVSLTVGPMSDEQVAVYSFVGSCYDSEANSFDLGPVSIQVTGLPVPIDDEWMEQLTAELEGLSPEDDGAAEEFAREIEGILSELANSAEDYEEYVLYGEEGSAEGPQGPTREQVERHIARVRTARDSLVTRHFTTDSVNRLLPVTAQEALDDLTNRDAAIRQRFPETPRRESLLGAIGNARHFMELLVADANRDRTADSIEPMTRQLEEARSGLSRAGQRLNEAAGLLGDDREANARASELAYGAEDDLEAVGGLLTEANRGVMNIHGQTRMARDIVRIVDLWLTAN